ncbi:endoplasmic reticulum resident protein 29 [Colletes gigas]|uniref:endoplasmic reticulum resident protein 29 n=1 Tax=Colletes gigas TaxID=935657 RepID=UPI001C9B5C52|nr:endoplasmic reticulum resident protein 29 [Colletes gigas]XP_043253547.1 endoplasmic reticulum resident protein 29 [Colletes gigas]
MLPSIAVILLAIGTAVAEDCKGCVSLDSYSFDKVIPKFKAAVVKFDVAYPYGDKHEQYSQIAATTKDAYDFLVAEVKVKDYGNKDNSDLAARYKIKSDAFPAVLLFLQGKTEPIQFVADKATDFTADNIKRFIKTKSSVYLGLPGCVEQLDKLAEEFKSSDENERKEILNKAKIIEETLPETQHAAAKVYIKTMERILEKGNTFVQTEQTRIDGILKGKLSNEKKRIMEEKRNILHSFLYKDEL